MLFIVFLTSTTTLSAKTGWATVNSQASYFPLPNSNATIIYIATPLTFKPLTILPTIAPLESMYLNHGSLDTA